MAFADLPRDATDGAPPAGPARPLVLVVGGHAAARAMTLHLFGELGCDAREAPSGEAALQILEAGFVPHVVLLDFKLPGMGGPQFYRLLRGCPLCRKAAVVPFAAQWDASGGGLPWEDLVLIVGHLLRERGLRLPGLFKNQMDAAESSYFSLPAGPDPGENAPRRS